MQKIYNLMVVDDDKDIRSLIKVGLSRELKFSFELDGFENAEAAFANCGLKNYDLVITDFKLPGMSGFEFIVQLRGLIHHETIPLIFISGHFTKQEMARYANRFEDIFFMDKPFEIKKLAKQISFYLSS